MNYAIIENGIVTNIVWLHPSTPFPNAVPYGDISVEIGDTYENGMFYRDGEQIVSVVGDMQDALNMMGVAP